MGRRKEVETEEKNEGIPLPLFQYLKSEKNSKLLTPEEERELGKMVKEGNKKEREKAIKELVRRNIRLVIFHASKYKYPKVDFEDLVQEGLIGLVQAAKKFDYQKGFRFSTYATFWIRQALLRRGYALSRTIRLPPYMAGRVKQVERITQQLNKEGISAPTAEEIADASGGELTEAQVALVQEKTSDTFSYDAMLGPDTGEELPIFEFIDFGQITDAETLFEDASRKQLVGKLFKYLSPREKVVMIMRFGLWGEHPMTVRELSEVYGISRERIRQIIRESSAKMAEAARTYHQEDLS